MQSLKGNSLISLNCNATMDWCYGTAIDGCWYVVWQWVKHHPRGNVVLARPEDFTAWLWNVETAACITVLSGHGGWVTCGDFTPDGTTFFFPSNKPKKKRMIHDLTTNCEYVSPHPYNPCLFFGGGCFWTRLRASPQVCTLARWLWAHLQWLSA
jgi:WD40 repeat protein